MPTLAEFIESGAETVFPTEPNQTRTAMTRPNQSAIPIDELAHRQHTRQQEAFLQNPLPSDTESERIILGAILLDNELIQPVKARLKPEHFYNAIHRAVFARMLTLENSTIDPIFVSKVTSEDDRDISIVTITNLYYGLPHFSEGSIRDYIVTVFNAAIARKIISDANQTITETLSGQYNLPDIIERNENRVLVISNTFHSSSGRVGRPGFQSLAEIKPQLIEHIVALSSGVQFGVPTGIPELDDKLDGNGLQNKGAYYFGALPKLGKTSLVLRIANHVATKAKRTVLIASAEMHKLSLTKRLYSPAAGIPYSEFKPGISGRILQSALEGIEEFSKRPLKISDSIYTMPELRKFMRDEVIKGQRMADRTGDESFLVGLGVIDYLQLFSAEAKMSIGKRVEEVTAISREAKLLANDLDFPVIGITSLNSGPMTEKREPEIGDAGWSKSIIYDAEAIWFIHNEAALDQDYEPPEVEDVTFIMKVQRNGPKARFNMKFRGKFMQFLTESEFAEIGRFDAAAKTREEEKALEEIWELKGE